MTNKTYKIKGNSVKNYISVLEDITKEFSKSRELPKGYNKLKNHEEKLNLLENAVLKSLNRKFHYKIYLSDEK